MNQRRMTELEKDERLRTLELRMLVLVLKIPRRQVTTEDFIEKAQAILDEMKPLTGE